MKDDFERMSLKELLTDPVAFLILSYALIALIETIIVMLILMLLEG